MKKIFRILYPYILPITLISFLLFSFKVIKLEYQFSFQSHQVYQNNFSWQKQIFFSEIKKFKNKIFEKKNQTNFSKVNIFVSEQNSRKLLSNLPASTKNWVKAYISYPDKKINLQEISLRFRGDNPINWLMQKKQLRIKTKKNELINGYRHFNYNIFNADEYLPYLISEKIGLINQKYNLVELYINGESHGLYMEQEKIDESFLRKNKLMPTNIYKGENNVTETYFGLNRNLFNNPNIWSKLAVFNQVDPSSTKDLARFLRLLKSNTHRSDPTINDYIDLEYFSKFEAFLTIINNVHHDFYHNMRLILDPWSGNITQLIIDPILGSTNHGLDFSSNDLGTFLNKNINFIHEKYKWIYYFYFEDDITNQVKSYIEKIKKDLSIVQKKEPYNVRAQDHTRRMEEGFLELNNNKKKFLSIFNSNPKSSWNKNINNFDIVINDYTPLYNLKIKFQRELSPKWVGIDINYDNIISQNEPKFLIDENLKEVKIPLIFYSNRFKINNNISTSFQNYPINHSKTYFRLIADNKALPIQIESKNFFNKNSFSIKEKKINNAVKTNNSNKIIFLDENKAKKKISLSGKVIINKNLIFNDEVEIKPGTIFLIKPNKHIIFKQRVISEGTTEQPIMFKKYDKEDLPWGSVAILGKKTMGSRFNNVIFDGGSGGQFNQYRFTSMFSIHNTKNIKILNSKFLSNELFDDTMHIIYSSDIFLENIEVNDAHGDAIDIDISNKIFIKNVKIKDSKNDGIDFMETDAVIENLEVTNSKDKGISIGENSKIIIKNSILKSNKIGAAIKDKSKGKFYKVKFYDNDIQLVGYAKNWRYGSGGNIQIYDSTIKAEENKFVTSRDPEDFKKKKDKNLNQNSEINIFNSKIVGNKTIIGKNFSFN